MTSQLPPSPTMSTTSIQTLDENRSSPLVHQTLNLTPPRTPPGNVNKHVASVAPSPANSAGPAPPTVAQIGSSPARAKTTSAVAGQPYEIIERRTSKGVIVIHNTGGQLYEQPGVDEDSR